MTDKEIQDGNRLIAEFMGYHQIGVTFYSNKPKPGSGNWFKHARYHSSWDWLIPVVQKIGKQTRGLASAIQYDVIMDELLKVEIQKVYLAVIKVITWHNSTKHNG